MGTNFFSEQLSAGISQQFELNIYKTNNSENRNLINMQTDCKFSVPSYYLSSNPNISSLFNEEQNLDLIYVF